MPSQQQETLEMISNLKKALRREKEGRWCTCNPPVSFRFSDTSPAPSSEPIYGTSNRGNKLKKGANHVHLGTLANTHGPEPYKQARTLLRDCRAAANNSYRESSTLGLHDTFSNENHLDTRTTVTSCPITTVMKTQTPMRRRRQTRTKELDSRVRPNLPCHTKHD